MPGRNHSREFKLQMVGQINAGLHTRGWFKEAATKRKVAFLPS